MLRLYEITDEYIQFLSTYAEGVYLNRSSDSVFSRKYVGPILSMNGNDFYAPLSSPKENDYQGVQARRSSITINRMVLNDELLGTVRLSHMIPVMPDGLTGFNILDEKVDSYRVLMLKQMAYLSKNENRIKKNALVVYKQKLNQKKYFGNSAPEYIKTTLNFSELEKKLSHFSAFRNDSRREALKQVAVEKKEFNKEERFKTVTNPSVLSDMSKDDAPLSSIIQKELEKGKEFLSTHGINKVEVGYDYEDEYYRPRRSYSAPVEEAIDEPIENLINEVEDEKLVAEVNTVEEVEPAVENIVEDIPKPRGRIFTADDILSDEFDKAYLEHRKAHPEEEIRPVPKKELVDEPVVEEKVSAPEPTIVVEEKPTAKKTEAKKANPDFPDYSEQEIDEKMRSKRAISLALRAINMKGARIDNVVGNIFNHEDRLYEIINYNSKRKIALLKDLTNKEAVVAIDFPKKDGVVEWSEERRFTLLWKANIEYTKF